jgi:hypothetical protein
MRYYDIIQPASIWTHTVSGCFLFYGGLAFVLFVVLWALSEEFHLLEYAKRLYGKFFKKE